MAQRIKYVKISETEFKTEGIIKTYGKGDVIATFSTSDNTFKITTSLGTEVLATGRATSPHKIKIKIKEFLTVFGAEFQKETRQPRKKD